MQDFYVYILKCSDESYYVGHTDSLSGRIDAHNTGKYPGYTSTRLPVELVYVTTAETREAALIFEHKIKKWSRKKKEALIRSDWAKIIELAKKSFISIRVHGSIQFSEGKSLTTNGLIKIVHKDTVQDRTK